MMDEQALEELNPEQAEAVTAPDGPLLVLAGAGSGKTRVLTHRIAHLMSRGVEPWRIAGVTFTNKAAEEMRRRVDILAGGAASRVMLHTFHALGARLLREHGDALGLPRGFSILDEDDSLVLVKASLAALGRSGDIAAEAAWSRISAAKSSGLGPAGFRERAAGPLDGLVADVFDGYEEGKARAAAADFDDLITLPVRLFTEHPGLAERFHDKVRHILVDEYQDTSPAQYAMLKALAGPRRNVTCVGDPDQSIYRWRGADIRNILEFERDFPDARVVTLERNYRSTPAILSAASELISHNRKRKPKKLWAEGPRGRPLAFHLAMDQDSEARFAAGAVMRLMEEGARPSDFAVLYRTNAQSRALEEAFVHARIPYTVVGGMKFYARREVKDMLSYLRLLVNPADTVAFARAASAPPRGIGETSLARLAGAAAVSGQPVLAAAATPEALALVPARSRPAVQGFLGLMRRLEAEAAERGWSEALALASRESGYADWLARGERGEAEDRMGNVRELLSAARSSEESGSSLEEFMEHAALLADIDAWKGAEPGTVLMTLHNAKGLEFPHVIVCGLEEGLLPHASSIADEDELEEERRLFYVGLTRAKETVTLAAARGRRTRDRFSWCLPSRFLSELPPALLAEVESPLSLPLPLDLEGTGVHAVRPDSGGPGETREPVDDGGGDAHPRPGTRVRHPRFGPGTVIQLSGAGDDLNVTVSFPRWGRKTFLARLARLEPLG